MFLAIKPIPKGQFYDVRVCSEYKTKADNPKWYWEAFAEFLTEGVTENYAASYNVPHESLELMETNLSIALKNAINKGGNKKQK